MIEHKLPVSLVFGDRVLKQWILANSLPKQLYSLSKGESKNQEKYLRT